MNIYDSEGTLLTTGLTEDQDVLEFLQHNGTIKSTTSFMIEEKIDGVKVVTNGIEEVCIIEWHNYFLTALKKRTASF